MADDDKDMEMWDDAEFLERVFQAIEAAQELGRVSDMLTNLPWEFRQYLIIIDVKITHQGFETRVVSQDLQLWLSNAPPNGNQLTSHVVGWYSTGPKFFAMQTKDCSIIIEKALLFAFVALSDSVPSAAVSAQSTVSTNLETR
ncbi:hypothetical protein Tco_0843424 [Tanacetum coccineum]|uniref:Uncharacterized protein n=1 Tax=Tanacetum coccineum TaxID=301880 RepID=A0ABQ5B4V4_9ASTR